MEEILDMHGLEEAFGASDVTSPKMRAGIEEWFRLYFDREPRQDYDPCLQIPYTVVRKLTRAVFAEYEAQSKGPFTAAVLKGLDESCRSALELALIGGESYLKPVTDGKHWYFRVLSRRQVLVFGRDAFGEVTDVGTIERSCYGRNFFTLLERRTLENGRLVITNRLYRSGVRGVLGREVSLHAHPLYSGLPEEFSMGMDSVGLIRLRNPAVNCIDGSREGVSVYAPAVGLIKSLGRNEAELTGEFSRGKSRIVVSADMLRDGKLQDDLFVGLDDSPEGVGITVFAPELREQSYLNRKTAYLRDVENILGLKRGLLGEVETAQRTATEITSSQGEYAMTIQDFQRVWEAAAHKCVGLCRKLGKLYGMEVDNQEAELRWGNGVLFDGNQKMEN